MDLRSRVFFPWITVVGLLFGEGPSYTYVDTWGGPGKGAGRFSNPEGMAVDPAGFLYIVDTGNHRIQKFSPEGAFVTEVGGFGWGISQFDRPLSVWAGNGLDVFVADFRNHRIQRYDKDLHFIGVLQGAFRSSGRENFGYPLDVALSPEGELFCLDGQNRRLLKFDVLGRFQMAFGESEAGEGWLIRPRRMALGGGKRLYVTDGPSIKVYDFAGNFLYAFGGDVLKDPLDLCVDDGWIWVAERGLRAVILFVLPGKPVGRVVPPPQALPFEDPVAVAVFKKRLYVLDRRRAAVYVFMLDG